MSIFMYELKVVVGVVVVVVVVVLVGVVEVVLVVGVVVQILWCCQGDCLCLG